MTFKGALNQEILPPNPKTQEGKNDKNQNPKPQAMCFFVRSPKPFGLQEDRLKGVSVRYMSNNFVEAEAVPFLGFSGEFIGLL